MALSLSWHVGRARGVSGPLGPGPAQDLQRPVAHWGRALGAAQGVPPAPTPSAAPALLGRVRGTEHRCPPLSPGHLRKWLHLACGCGAAWLAGARRPGRPGSPPPAEGWRAWRCWHWLAVPAAPPCCPAPRWASWPGLRPLQPGWRTLPGPPGPPCGCGQEFRALAAPMLPGWRGEDREAAGGEPCALGGCRNPLRHTSGRRGDPLAGHRAWEPSVLGKEGQSRGARRTGPAVRGTCVLWVCSLLPHMVYSVTQQAFTEHLTVRCLQFQPVLRVYLPFPLLPLPAPWSSGLQKPSLSSPKPRHGPKATVSPRPCSACIALVCACPGQASLSGVPSLQGPVLSRADSQPSRLLSGEDGGLGGVVGEGDSSPG